MTTVSLKLPELLLREVEQEAATRGVAKSAIIRDCIERTLRKKKKPKGEVSCLDLMGDLVGSFHGPRDLSTNRRYLTEAIAANARRSPKNGR
jgi:Ribbon-helix-helix protein, copG family